MSGGSDDGMRAGRRRDADFEDLFDDLPPPVPRPAPLRHYLRGVLRRLGIRPAARPAPATAVAEDVRLERARAALAEARQEMPGLLGELDETPPPPPNLPAHARSAAVLTEPRRAGLRPGPVRLSISPGPASSGWVSEADGRSASGPLAEPGERERVARVEALLARLEEERRQLGSQVSALRLIVEELRDVLVRLDERAPALGRVPRPAPRAGSRPRALSPTPLAALELRLVPAADAAVDRLRRTLAGLPEVESVRCGGVYGEEAVLQLQLRVPRTERELIDLLARITPGVMPRTGPAPATLLLRLRPA